MKQNIAKNIAFITRNDMNNWLSSFISFLFLISHHAINKTYHNLKNSQGCILGRCGISIHHLAQLYSAHIQGTNTMSCSINVATVIIKIFFCFLKKSTGILYTAKAMMMASTMFLKCLKK
jgi:hypothetical protein